MARKASRSKRGSVTMRAPARSVALSITEPKMCAIGMIPATTSSGPRCVSGNEAKPRSVATAPACVWAALLGSPVVPLELSSSAIAPGSTASGSADPGLSTERQREQRLDARGRRGLRGGRHRGRVGDHEARADLAHEGAELARGEQRAGRRQRQAGGKRAVHRHREVGAVGGDERQDVAAPRAAGPQAGGEGAHPLGELAVGERAAGRGVDHRDPLGPAPRARRAPPRAAAPA